MTKLLIDKPDSSIVCVSGILSYTTAEQVEKELMELLHTRHISTLWVDMKQVRFIDSAGLFPFVHVLCQANQLDKELVLCSIPPCVDLVLNITGLASSFNISNSIGSNDFHDN